MPKFLFLDDDPERHTLFRARAIAKFSKTGEENKICQVFTAEEAIKFLNGENPQFDVVFLDRDLGRARSGESVAQYLINLPSVRRPKKIVIHSRNFLRGPVMVRKLREAGYHVVRAPFK